MADDINQRFLDNVLSHKVGLERLSNGISERLMQKIKERISERVFIPEKAGELNTMDFNKLINDITKVIEETINIEYESMREEFVEVVNYEKKFNQNSMTRMLPEAIASTVKLSELDPSDLINKMSVGGSNEVIKDVFYRLSKKTAFGFKNRIITGYRNGENPRDIAETIFQYNKSSVDPSNVTELKKLRNGIDTLTRTAVNSINAEVNKDTLDKNKRLLKGYMWTSTLDSRTSLICASRDGRIYPVDTNERPPAHYNCRSIMTPIFKSKEELGVSTRASMDGQVPAKQNYEEWLKTKSDRFIKKTLGKTRGQLFIDGKINLDGFVNRNGKTYTLKELEKEDGINLDDFKF